MVEAEPHVVTRMKRIFPKMDRFAQGIHRLSDTPENARELLWFIQRYPLETKAKAWLQSQSQRFIDQQSSVDGWLSGATQPKVFSLAKPPRPHQSIAAGIVLETGGLLVMDDVGEGKTITAITMISDPRARPALVVTLPNLPIQWNEKIKEFAPGLRVHIVKKATPYDVNATRGAKKLQLALIKQSLPDVLVMNYHKLSGWAETLAPLISSVTWDEVQELRNRGTPSEPTDKYVAAHYLASKVRFRLGLSATPIYGYGKEFKNVMDCIRPGVLGTDEEFNREWCDGKLIKEPKAFGVYIRESGLAVRKLNKRKPEERGEIIPHFIDSDTKVFDKATDRAYELARIILASTGAPREKMEAAGQLDNMIRQATGIAKAPHVAAFVKMLAESGEQLLLFGWHRAVYDIWLQELKDLNPAMYTGSESPKQKEMSKMAFMRGDARVNIISLRSGAGIDGLEKVCALTVHGELDWSSGIHTQNIGRVDRGEQRRRVRSYMLISETGSDPLMAEVLGLKTSQSEGILNPDAPLVERLQRNEGHIRRLAEQYIQRARGARA